MLCKVPHRVATFPHLFIKLCNVCKICKFIKLITARLHGWSEYRKGILNLPKIKFVSLNKLPQHWTLRGSFINRIIE